ncbi:MAG: ribosome biogenesis GTPase Der, partial [Actinobacteria bacterium]|nr:ribosome biogenesis GTPase Der [Actinomycetota bacterium]
MKKGLPRIAIVGKPNAGKSTLVNRICRKREAIVHHDPMITRDRKYYLTDWGGKYFYILDTGGINPGSGKKMDLQILMQTKKAIDESDAVIFLVDITQPVSAMDEEIAGMLRKSGRYIIFAGNKWDDVRGDFHTEDYLKLGLGYPVKISAIHGKNIGDLLDEIIEKTPAFKNTWACTEETEKIPVISILGRPNVGKSTLFNTLIREERAIVDEVEGTTRDSIDSVVKIGEKTYKFIDTAGIKKKDKKMEDLEYYSSLRTLRAAGESDIALVLIDSSAGIAKQDLKIIEYCTEKGLSCCVILSKTDKPDPASLKQLDAELARKLRFASFIPVLKISALKKTGIGNIVRVINRLYNERNK